MGAKSSTLAAARVARVSRRRSTRSRRDLPRDERVRSRADFVRAQRRPLGRIRSGSFILLIASHDGGPTRLGIVASKKVGNAVMRNRAKRLVREVYRLHKPDVDSLDVVVIVSDRLPHLKFDQLESEWTGAMAELRSRAKKLVRGGLARSP